MGGISSSNYGFQHFFYFWKTAIESSIFIMWDLESFFLKTKTYSTTLNIVRLVKRPPSLMNQCFHFTILPYYHTTMNSDTILSGNYYIYILNQYHILWKYYICLESTLHITFLGTLDQCSIYNLFWTILHLWFWTEPPTSGHSEPGTRINSAAYIWALWSTTNYEPILTTI